MNKPRLVKRAQRTDSAEAELEELCRVHDISLELIGRSDDPDDLMELVLDELERRLDEIPVHALGNTAEPALDENGHAKVRALVAFAGQAAALKERAEASRLLADHARDLEAVNARLEQALGDTDSARQQLDGVLEVLDSAILIVDREGCIKKANRAACDLAGQSPATLAGQAAGRFVGHVEADGDGEVVLEAGGDHPRVLLVSRRGLGGEHGEEVVLLHDITERDRAVAEQHRSDKMDELFRAVRVLAHKINNPLTALVGRSQLLRMARPDDPELLKAVDIIEEASNRIAGLIRTLAAVAKAGSGEGLEKVLRMDDADDADEVQE